MFFFSGFQIKNRLGFHRELGVLGEFGCGRRWSGSDLLLGRFVSSVFLEDQCGNAVMCGNVNVV